MLELRTLGGAYVRRNDGTPLRGAVAQRRSLALLSILAAHGEAGIRREGILALLWPDADPERSRHALTQSLYHIRRAVGCEDLFVTAVANVRLNGCRITSDVGVFAAFVAANEDERAIAVYGGPFLDGFVLPECVEFDQWVSIQRARINCLATRSLERIANAAETRADWRAAVSALEQLV